MMREIRIAIAVSIMTCTLVTAKANAADLENCANYPEYQQKTDCLYKNEVLLNSVLQVTVAELRKSVQDLQGDVSNLKIEVQTLKSNAPDLSKYFKVDDQVKLLSNAWGGTCIDNDTHDAGHIQGWGCTDHDAAQNWTLKRGN